MNLVMEMEARNIAQRKVCHIFCVKLGDSVTTTHGTLQQAFGDDALSRSQAFLWHKTFSEGRTFVEDEQRSGRPSATQTGDNTARVREIIRFDRRLIVRMAADEVNTNRRLTVRMTADEVNTNRRLTVRMTADEVNTNRRFTIRMTADEVNTNRRLTVRMTADEANTNRETVCLILTEELEMRKICAKMVHRNLTGQQRNARLSAF